MIFLFVESLPSMDGACTMVKVKANSLGTSKVTVTYSYKDVVLRAEVTIAAYKPLKVSLFNPFYQGWGVGLYICHAIYFQ